MQIEKLISVIVPIYKVEKYIRKCVESLQAQKYKNIEIILVDDGSPDSSASIIDEMAASDSRIIVIHQKNLGVSAARNAGIRRASGEYLMFVDGDDWVDKDCVSYFVNLVEKQNCLIGMNPNNYTLRRTVSIEKSYTLSAEEVILFSSLFQRKNITC